MLKQKHRQPLSTRWSVLRIERTLATKLITLAKKFQAITLTGPRQAGKTTLVRATFPALPYVSLEEPDIRQIALTDAHGFLANYPNGAILDEIQNAPDLFSYIQSWWMGTGKSNSF